MVDDTGVAVPFNDPRDALVPPAKWVPQVDKTCLGLGDARVALGDQSAAYCAVAKEAEVLLLAGYELKDPHLWNKGPHVATSVCSNHSNLVSNIYKGFQGVTPDKIIIKAIEASQSTNVLHNTLGE